MRTKSYYLILILITICIFLLSCNVEEYSSDKSNYHQAQSLLSKVLEHGTIRCAYIVYEPSVIYDPNSNQIYGIFPDVLKEAGRLLDLSIEFNEEVTWANMIEGLERNRYDLVAGVWANPSRAKRADFSIPLYYNGIGIYVRKDDSRFSSLITTINNPNIKISAIDGEMASYIAKESFPKATRLELPENVGIFRALDEVVNKKADVTFVDTFVGEQYIKNNPNSLINISKDEPINVFPNVIMLPQREHDFREMLDTTIQHLVNIGFIEKVIKKYETNPNSLYRTQLPYRSKQSNYKE